MFKDILVVLGEDEKRASSYGLSLARQFDAHATAAYVGKDSVLAEVALAETRYDLAIDAEAQVQVQAEEKAADRLGDFVRQAREAGVRARAVLPDDLDWPQIADLPKFARGFDLTIIAQPRPGESRAARRQIGSLLARSGRPLLVVPYIQSAPADFGNVIVAWDASRPATRALADAMPILRRAGAVEIVTVAAEVNSNASWQGASVTRHLGAHGIDATFMTVAAEIDAGNALLSYAADAGASFMVAGGYGHARLREAVLGGVTRTLLQSMTIPVLISH